MFRIIRNLLCGFAVVNPYEGFVYFVGSLKECKEWQLNDNNRSGCDRATIIVRAYKALM
jgi:hypothetical protein